MSPQTHIENIIGTAATKIAEDINADAIVSIERNNSEIADNDSPFYEIKLSIFRRTAKLAYSKTEYCKKIKRPDPGSTTPIKELLMEAIANKYITKGDRVVCIQDSSIGNGYKAMLLVFDVDKLFFDISTNKLAEHIEPEILEAIFDLAMDIVKEGREGKRIGTAFIIGKPEIMEYTKQLIINPFAYIDDSMRKITDPRIKETIKEFAQLDGVFFIDEQGIVLSAGTYIDIDTAGLDISHGLGTRHRNCAAITARTDSIAIVVSESGGKIRVFKKGKIVIEI